VHARITRCIVMHSVRTMGICPSSRSLGRRRTLVVHRTHSLSSDIKTRRGISPVYCLTVVVRRIRQRGGGGHAVPARIFYIGGPAESAPMTLCVCATYTVYYDAFSRTLRRVGQREREQTLL